MMQRPTLIFNLIVTFLLSLSTACVSVNLVPKASHRADGVKYREPTPPFAKESRDEVDAAWKNIENGNALSYLSDCQDPTDPPLKQITAGILAGLNDLSVHEETTVTVQGREGRRVHASGKVDGVPTQIDILTFKRNHCIYVLSYVGVQKFFADDRNTFENFIAGFEAP